MRLSITTSHMRHYPQFMVSQNGSSVIFPRRVEASYNYFQKCILNLRKWSYLK